ncbi:MAG TPA: hypothetical protein VE360_19320, partial [Pyrinomonadaceae bacterium]|nr:hypothetical protein [Pyrinomonadaceae bacterium]
IRQDQPKEGAFVVRLTEGGRPAGALSISLYPANDLFKVGGVVEPPCRDVETYLNDDKKGADKHNLQNWDRLRLTLAGREYILRLGHQENTIFVTFNKAASFPSP